MLDFFYILHTVADSVRQDGGEGVRGMTGVASNPFPSPLKELKRTVLFLAKGFFVTSIFNLQSDTEFIPSKFTCLHKCILCIYCNVWSPVMVIVTSYSEFL